MGSLKVSLQTKTTEEVFSLSGLLLSCETKVGATVSINIVEITVGELSTPLRDAFAVML
jgi:hypothetical protein